MRLRTDLAVEARELAGGDVKGVDYSVYRENGLEISRLTVKDDRAKHALGKEKGTYITIELPSLTEHFSDTDDRLRTIGGEIRRLLPVHGLLLVAGLGNEEITPDSLGPKTASRVLATRHITGEIARATGLDRLRPVAVLSTGVTGQTGIETGEYIHSIVSRIRPSAVIAIDALASRRPERLGCTLQISDTGISPGAGVGNRRTAINRLLLQEYIPLGQRVGQFRVEYHDGHRWLSLPTDEQTTTIGYKRILRFPTVQVRRLRLTIIKARATTCLSEIAAYEAR